MLMSHPIKPGDNVAFELRGEARRGCVAKVAEGTAWIALFRSGGKRVSMPVSALEREEVLR